MRIRGIFVEGVGMFATPTRIEGFEPGVNILSAGNEAGKSTIFKAIRACLFERHNTNNRDVAALATEGLSLPVTVSLDFEHDGGQYELTKSFLKSPKAELRREGQAIARGREADESAWRLLGIAPGSGRSVDPAAFGLLWVGQGKSFTTLQPTEAATTALNEAIQQEVGELVGGERARAVLQSLRSDLENLITKTGRPRAGGPYDGAQSWLDGLEDALRAAEGKLTDLDGRIAELASKRGDSERLSDPREAERISGELGSARQALNQGEDALKLLQEATKDEELAAAKREQAEADLDDLLERAARIDQDRQELQRLQAELGPLTERETDARDNIKSAEKAIAEIDADEEKRQQRLNEVDRIFGAVERFGQRPQLERRAEELRKLQEELVQNRAALSENRATAGAVEKVNGLELDLDRLTARMEAAAPQVEIALGASAVGQVRIGEEELAENASLRATEPLEIQVGELATITVSPSAGTQEDEQKELKRLRTELQQLLGDVGATTSAEVRAAYARRLELERNRQGLAARMTALDVTEADLAATAEATRAELQQVDALLREIRDEHNLDALPSPDEVESERQALRESSDEAARKRKALEETLAVGNDNRTEIVRKLADAQGTERARQQRLDGDLGVLPDADRERLIDDAQKAFDKANQEHRAKAAALEEHRRQAPQVEEVEGLRLQVHRLEEASDNRNQRIVDLEKGIANLEGRIENAGGDGLGERVETLREQRDLASREVGRHERRIATLQLLEKTIEGCYEEQRERLHAPLLRHLQPFLHDIFPSAELKLGDGFAVEGLKRDGPAPENFERLSDGTKEQIAVLVRLAMGAMLCERGQEVPIILDDALVFSDDTRIEQMFNALTRAGKNQQVIVFTCRTRTFETLGGRPLSIAQHVA